jgi:ABC-2 type transport system permease protein
MFALQLIEFAFMLVIDLVFLVALVMLMLPLGIWRQAAFAVMKRNFIGYFSNPTGYVFLCLFVLLTSFAAFWPHEFFTTNLANFDQLNKFLPFIMLIFIPAITMGIWAEERRQGTDELLLTLPAKDFDIVIGKYFAAVLVFTVSLLFSQLSNYGVLLAMTGGQLDNLLLFSTYLGYWFMGIAMISLGMVASFLTNNLTVGFIFGVAINAPLAFFSSADVIFSNSKWIQWLYEWSLLQRFEPFGRGLISAASICYFLGLVVIGIYLSLILIGRRHWLGGRDGTSLFWHYIARAILLLVAAVSTVLFVQHGPLNRLRADISDSQVSTLSDSTIEILNELASDSSEDRPPVKIEAYISSNVPTEFVKTRYDLVNLLREFDVLGGNRVQVTLNQNVEPFSQEAILAEKRYGIRPVRVTSQSRGANRDEDVILGVAFSSGLERIVLPFLPYGMPIEYELMRSINTVSRSERKTIGIVTTDALISGAVVRGQQQSVRIPRLQIVSELEKQYTVEQVDASNPIALWTEGSDGEPASRNYDVLLVVQPSKMTPGEMNNLITAIQSGQPTAIFEDPFPNPENFEHVRGTFFPRTIARQGSESANIQDLWDALDMDVDRVTTTLKDGREQKISWIVWQNADNPYPANRRLDTPELVIVKNRDPDDPRFSTTHPSTRGSQSGESQSSGIDEMLFQYTGDLAPVPDTELEYDPLVTTGKAGRIRINELLQTRNPAELVSKRGAARGNLLLAAAIRGGKADSITPSNALDVQPSPELTNVIYVADIDVLSDYFVQIRNEPIQQGIEYHFQNMNFVLNAIDTLSGENTYLDLRNRRVEHVTLEVVEKTYSDAMEDVYEATNEFEIELTAERNKIQADMNNRIKPLQESIRRELAKKEKGKPYDANKLAAQQVLLQQEGREQANKYQTRIRELENERSERKRQIDLDAELKIQEIQRWFKLMAVIVPPIPPLIVGTVVFFRRRLREREGISKARRLK